jgi:hypothetical protein
VHIAPVIRDTTPHKLAREARPQLLANMRQVLKAEAAARAALRLAAEARQARALQDEPLAAAASVPARVVAVEAVRVLAALQV